MRKKIVLFIFCLITSLNALDMSGINIDPNIKEENKNKTYNELIPYLKSSNNGELYFYLASIYLNGSNIPDSEGNTVEKDTNEAIYWYEMAIKKGYPYASAVLGSLYLYHEDFIVRENNIELAEKYLIKSIEDEIYESYTPLADIYFNYKGDAKTAVRFLFAGAEKNIATAQYGLAVIYNTGLKSDAYNIEKNELISIKYLTKACMNPKKTKQIKNICTNPNIISKEQVK